MFPALTSLTGGGGLTGGAGGDGGPSNAGGSTTNRMGFDASGWAVNFGAGGTAAATPTGKPFDWKIPAMIAGAGLLVWLIARRK